jgi:pimeloyl-ACP methyl ester carboxylesterase
MKLKLAAITTMGLVLGLACAAAPASLAASVRPAGMRSAGISGPAAPPVPVLKWRPCQHGFQCAMAPVPLDYRHPHSATIGLLVFRHPATDPARRLGALFVNGGGPSAQYVNVTSGYTAIPAALRARYDIIGFDPRGFGASAPVRCFPTMAAEARFLSPLPAGFPVGARQIAVWDATWAAFGARCAHRVPAGLLAHDRTADVARDMNLLRQAVGAKILNYYGLSYGTALGAIYANLFPAHVGRIALDGNMDPVAYTTNDHIHGMPMFLRDREDEASAATLRAFLDLCGKAPATACAFTAGTPAATRAKFATLIRRLRAHPVFFPGTRQTCGFACAVESVPLTQVSSWPSGARLLQELWAATTAHTSAVQPLPAVSAAARTAWPAIAATRAMPPAEYAGPEQSFALTCSDGPNPRHAAAYTAAARLAYARSGPMGGLWAWPTEACAHWPATRDRYTGPWDRRTAHPILLLGITGDPDTPYWDSLALAHDLARARLLTIDGYGHEEFANPSTCATNYLLRYLLTGALPAKGAVCQQNGRPFG